MKEYMNYSANDKMVEHRIFWDTIWNVVSVALAGVIIVGAIVLMKQMGSWL